MWVLAIKRFFKSYVHPKLDPTWQFWFDEVCVLAIEFFLKSLSI